MALWRRQCRGVEQWWPAGNLLEPDCCGPNEYCKRERERERERMQRGMIMSMRRMTRRTATAKEYRSKRHNETKFTIHLAEIQNKSRSPYHHCCSNVCWISLSQWLNIEDPPFVVNDLLLNCISRTLDGRWPTDQYIKGGKDVYRHDSCRGLAVVLCCPSKVGLDPKGEPEKDQQAVVLEWRTRNPINRRSFRGFVCLRMKCLELPSV